MKKILAALSITTLWLWYPAFAGAQNMDKYYLATTGSNVRAAPTTNSYKIGFLAEGKRVRVLGTAAGGTWYRVQLTSGQVGFVYSPLLKEEADTVSESDKAKLTGGPTAAPEEAFTYIIWPSDGEVIPGGEFLVLFGLHDMGVAPAGVDKEFTGHHHLLIDTDLPPLNEAIPNDDHYVHFGRGQTEYLIRLPKGKHTLQLLLGDKDHIPHTPPVMSEKITIQVP